MGVYILLGFIVLIALGFGILKATIESELSRSAPSKSPYTYNRKQYFLTRSEKEFYDKLYAAVGSECVIFAQVHLSSILDHQVKGQSWRGALSHIQRKSVDFLICDRQYLSPKLAIELDDYTHSRPERQERDEIVNELFKNSGIPILRIRSQDASNIGPIANEIRSQLRK